MHLESTSLRLSLCTFLCCQISFVLLSQCCSVDTIVPHLTSAFLETGINCVSAGLLSHTSLQSPPVAVYCFVLFFSTVELTSILPWSSSVKRQTMKYKCLFSDAELISAPAVPQASLVLLQFAFFFFVPQQIISRLLPGI